MYESAAEREAFFESLVQYRAEGVLGEGAFGLAILAYHEIEQRYKVFKLPKTPKTVEALKTEGSNLVKLRDLLHPNIIQLHEFGKVVIDWQGQQVERYYLILAYGGKSLRSVLGELKVDMDADGNAHYSASGQALSHEIALRIAIEICQGLEAAHGFKDPNVRMLHRDIKPENILIDEKTSMARLTDFGLSRVIDRSSGICSIAGTLLYMDPECFKGRAGTFSDIYSLGIVMYEMFTGELPFSDFPARLAGPPPDPRQTRADIPDEIAAVILRAMQPDLADRYGNATEMLAHLHKAAAGMEPLPETFEKIKAIGPRRFLCRPPDMDEPVVVQLLENDASPGLIERDAVSVARVAGERVIKPSRPFRHQHLLGIVWPAPGPSLYDRFGSGPITDAEDAHQLCDAVASACDILADLHEAGMAHGLLGPDCICYDGDSIVLYGHGAAPALAIRPDHSTIDVLLRDVGDRVGFFSPALLNDRLAPQAADDVFGIGAILCRMFTGRHWADDGALAKLADGDRPDLADGVLDSGPCLTSRLVGIIRAALDVDEKTTSAADLASRIRQCRWPEDVVDSLVEEALRAYDAGDLVRACELLDRALEADPGNSQIHYTRGGIYFREAEHAWALKELKIAARVNAGPRVWLMVGQCHQALGDLKSAQRAFEEACTHEETAEARELLARALHARGEHLRAQEQLQQAIELTDDDEEAAGQRKALLAAWRGAGELPAKATTEPED